jgi:hypothetical protein
MGEIRVFSQDRFSAGLYPPSWLAKQYLGGTSSGRAIAVGRNCGRSSTTARRWSTRLCNSRRAQLRRKSMRAPLSQLSPLSVSSDIETSNQAFMNHQVFQAVVIAAVCLWMACVFIYFTISSIPMHWKRSGDAHQRDTRHRESQATTLRSDQSDDYKKLIEDGITNSIMSADSTLVTMYRIPFLGFQRKRLESVHWWMRSFRPYPPKSQPI